MEGVFLLLVFFFYILVRLAFRFRPDARVQDRKRLAEGLALVSRRLYPEAIVYFDEALARQPRSVEALLARGRCHLETDELLLALSDCSKAINLDAHLPDAYLVRGKALYRMAQYEQALVEFDKAAWYGRDMSEPLCWRGLTWAKLGQPAKAEADFMQAKGMGDENASFYLRKADNLQIWS